jgi:hypothetical protein
MLPTPSSTSSTSPERRKQEEIADGEEDEGKDDEGGTRAAHDPGAVDHTSDPTWAHTHRARAYKGCTANQFGLPNGPIEPETSPPSQTRGRSVGDAM